MSHQLSHTFPISDAEVQMPVMPPSTAAPTAALNPPSPCNHLTDDYQLFWKEPRTLWSYGWAAASAIHSQSIALLDLGSLNFGSVRLPLGQQCKSKAKHPLSVPHGRDPPHCAGVPHSFPLHLCSGTTPVAD